MADTGCPQVPETQGFATSTAMSAVGTVTESDNVVIIIGNIGADTLPFPLDVLFGLTEYTSTYTEETIADQGLVSYNKGMVTDTSGMATTNLYNVQTDKIVDFIGTDTGRMTSEEATVLDGAGTWFENEEIMICPFASPNDNLNPPFCNIVQEGSGVDLTIGSLSTTSAQRFIMKKASGIEGQDFPVSDPGVESDYAIKLTGFGEVPAMGSADAFINVHVQEGRAFEFFTTGDEFPKAEDLMYSETTTASGDIVLFQKVMNYNSKITAPGPAYEAA